MVETPDKYKCSFCGNEYTRERTLINHLCEKKRRWMNRKDKQVIYGFSAWKAFYSMTGSAIGKELTYTDFMNTKFYTAFVRFGRHVVNTNMINPELFIRFVINNHIKLDDWCKDSVYEEYVRVVCRREDVNTAMERQVKLITKWAEENNEEWVEFFSKIAPGLAYKWILSGRISPWILLNDSAEKKLFSRLSDEQLMHIAEFINFEYWRIRMKHDGEDATFVQKILEESGL